MIIRIFAVLALLGALNTASESLAQSLFGGGNTGGNTAGRNTTGGNAAGGISGNSGFGQVGLGQSAAGTLSVSDGSITSNTGAGTFAGSRSGATFVGGNASTTQSFNNTRSQFSSLQNRGNTGRGQANRTQTTQRKLPRTQYRIGFTAPVIPVQQIQSNLQSNVIELPQLAYADRSVNLVVDDQGVVTMSGSVNSDREKKLLEAYVSMEPGVRKVTNELKVQAPIE